MNRRIWRWIQHGSIAAVIIYAALVAASAIYLYGMTRLYLLRPPYLQWIEAVRWWRYAPSVLFWLSMGAAGPVVVLVLAGMIVRRQRRQAPQKTLYGTTEFATPSQLRKDGINLKRRPF